MRVETLLFSSFLVFSIFARPSKSNDDEGSCKLPKEDAIYGLDSNKGARTERTELARSIISVKIAHRTRTPMHSPWELGAERNVEMYVDRISQQLRFIYIANVRPPFIFPPEPGC